GYAFGAFYRKKLADNRAVAFYGEFNSVSDKPFARAEDNGINVFAIYKIQKNEFKDLVFVLNYSNRPTILSGIPIPGFAYVWNPKPEVFTVFGLPANYALWIPADNLIITTTMIIPLTFKVDFNYRFYGPLLAFVGWEMDHQYYLVSDRQE